MKYLFSEKYLQIIWNEQLLSTHPRTMDGRTIRVLSTGLWNSQPGPDFRDAAVLIGGEIRYGDIEVHRCTSDWYAHHHDRDKRYLNVVLHVVWENDLETDAGCSPIIHLPTLELRSCLQRGWQRIMEKIEYLYYPQARQIPAGACRMRWAMTDNSALQDILREAGEARLAMRGAALLRQCAQSGNTSQTLYEYVFECLGYSNNRDSFRQLAHAVPLSRLKECDMSEESIGALLYGKAGMLPDPTTCRIVPQLRPWLCTAWRIWWQSGHSAQPILWNSNGARPLNSIIRRIAAGIYWIIHCNADPEGWLNEQIPTGQAMIAGEVLRKLMRPVRENPIWRTCLSFDTRISQGAALLGRQRMTDIALNVYLPYLYATAELREDTTAMTTIRNAYAAIPRMPGNHTLHNACLRFLSPPSREKEILKYASQQQGIMDIFKNFCLALNHDCNACPFSCDTAIPPDAE